MFNLIRRFSYSVIPRPDRPWADDATSNAPQVGRKRRLSITERDQDPDIDAARKKVRGESVASSIADSSRVATPQLETAEVKHVTQGVKQVELQDVAPETIPLPEEEEGELDEPASNPSTSPQDPHETDVEDSASTPGDIASSTNGDAEDSAPAASVAAEEVEISDPDKSNQVAIPDSEVARDGEPTTSPVSHRDSSEKDSDVFEEAARDDN